MGSLLVSIGQRIIRLGSWLKRVLFAMLDWIALNDYMRSDRRPWRAGYNVYRIKYLTEIIRDASIIEIFRNCKLLPARYGWRMDARAVEIPWVLSRLAKREGRLLDAGSSFNSKVLLTVPELGKFEMSIVTLAPEPISYWMLGVSYVFGDLRHLVFRDDWFDVVSCISTIEHVGMDNSLYAGSAQSARRTSSDDFVFAVKELKRILKPGGILYITFPFGVYEDHGWLQQFDGSLADTLIQTFNPIHVTETVYRYESDGWKLSDRISCAQCKYFDIHTSKYFNPKSNIEYPVDYPAAERAVMCLELHK